MRTHWQASTLTRIATWNAGSAKSWTSSSRSLAATSTRGADELKIAITRSLNSIAIRIDRGYNVEVRAGLPAGEEQEANEADERAREVIAASQLGMRYLKLEGEPILSLPEPPDDVDNDVAEPAA